MTLQKKLSKATIVICLLAILFAVASIYSANSMRATAQSMYEHPYTVTGDNSLKKIVLLLDTRKILTENVINLMTEL